MKINVSTSDIKGMVMEGVKKCLFEGMDIRSLIENLPISQALDPYRQVFGEDAFNALSTSRGDIFDVMQQTFDNGTPEQQQEYVARVKGEFQGDDGGIDIELDPDVMAMISETIDRVVSENINEFNYPSEGYFWKIQLKNGQKITSDKVGCYGFKSTEDALDWLCQYVKENIHDIELIEGPYVGAYD